MTACNSKSVSKEWQLDDLDFTESFKEMPADQVEMAKKSIADNLKEVKGKVIFNFAKNNELVLTAPNFDGTTDVVKGKWSISKDEKVITTEIEDKNTKEIIKQVFNVQTLESNRLVLSPEEQKLRMVFIPKK